MSTLDALIITATTVYGLVFAAYLLVGAARK